jgi:hypothetical protein
MRLLALFSMVAALGMSAKAATTFTLDPAQSSVTLSGTTVGNAPLVQQGPGSLTTQIEGTLSVDLSATEITIAGGSLDARVNGTWQPGVGGTGPAAPADFGAQATTFFGPIFGALRNVIMEVGSPAEAVQNNQFDASRVVFTFSTNANSRLDYNAGLAGTGSALLEGESTNRTATVGTISGSAGSRVLTIAVDTTFHFSLASDNDTALTIRGQIVAREGNVEPNPDGPRITNVQVVNNEVRITATGTTAATRVQASTTLAPGSWALKEAQITAPNATTRVFTVPVTGPKEFYRLVQ